MIIDCISDLHGFQPELPGGDLLIVAGDLTARDTPPEYDRFAGWLKRQKYLYKIVIAGNHDGLLQRFPERVHHTEDLERFQGRLYSSDAYLCDSGVEVWGFKIWGSPWTPTMLNWHFMKDRGDPIKAMWDLIPDDTEILITHGPAYGIQDQVGSKLLGCEELRRTIDTRLKKLKLHVFGHIHDSYGKVTVNSVIHVNASIMDEQYNPVNKPIRVIL